MRIVYEGLVSANPNAPFVEMSLRFACFTHGCFLLYICSKRMDLFRVAGHRDIGFVTRKGLGDAAFALFASLSALFSWPEAPLERRSGVADEYLFCLYLMCTWVPFDVYTAGLVRLFGLVNQKFWYLDVPSRPVSFVCR